MLPENAPLAPDRLYRSTEIRHWLRQAVARLSPRAAEMFALRFFEGRDNPEIAQVLGTTPGSVAVTLSRTRDRIQQEFRAYMGEIR
jgi:RNA polymerase sigma-70 factor (ECF subfamily)